MHIRRQSGFSLIEIAIVLVVIGLLIGGVLQGTALINNARTKDLIAAMQDTRAAVAAFKDRYGFLPGDMPTATANIPGMTLPACTTNGNGNGTWNTAVEGNCARDELILSGLLRGTPGSALRVQNSNITFANVALAGAFAPPLPATWVNVIVISNIDCDSATQLDRALDDGDTGTGNFRTSVLCAGQIADTTVPLAALRIN